MVRKTIQRKLTTTTISGFRTELVGGEPRVEPIPPVTVAGRLADKEVLRALRAVHGRDNSLTVGSVSYEEGRYEISIEDFLKYATKIE